MVLFYIFCRIFFLPWGSIWVHWNTPPASVENAFPVISAPYLHGASVDTIRVLHALRPDPEGGVVTLTVLSPSPF